MGISNTEIPHIIDIEASGFGSTSYPIEVGVILADGERYCSIVKPAPSWLHWDVEAESVHGLTRHIIESEGRAIKTVATELNQLLAGETIYSDGWVVDKPWLISLFDQAGIDMDFTISSLESILQAEQIEYWDRTKNRLASQHQVIRHRASNDAWLIQRTFIVTRQRIQMAELPVFKGS